MGRTLNFHILKESQNLKHYFGGDIQKFSSKLPGFVWAKYSGEKHLPSYNYLGPGTRLDIRLNENNNPKPGEEPINEIDRLAYIHDLAHQNSDDINERHRADQEMINGLKQLKNLSIPQRLVRALIIKLFQAKIKLGQGVAVSTEADSVMRLPRASSPKEKRQRLSKEKAINRLYNNEKTDIKTKYELDKMTKLANELHRQRLAEELHKPFRKPKQLRKIKVVWEKYGSPPPGFSKILVMVIRIFPLLLHYFYRIKSTIKTT